jgi:hypothetical protein
MELMVLPRILGLRAFSYFDQSRSHGVRSESSFLVACNPMRLFSHLHSSRDQSIVRRVHVNRLGRVAHIAVVMRAEQVVVFLVDLDDPGH